MTPDGQRTATRAEGIEMHVTIPDPAEWIPSLAYDAARQFDYSTDDRPTQDRP